MGLHGLRILILAALGLGALYCIHLIAQDYQKIRKPLQAAKALLNLRKRDLTSQISHKQESPRSTSTEASSVKEDPEATIDWVKIMKYDPLGCALSLICQLSASDELKQNTEGNILYNFISANLDKNVPVKLKRAYRLGEKYNKNHPNDYKRCYTEYPLCLYSARTMLNILQYYTYFFG